MTPQLRLMPAPVADPPYDDEQPALTPPIAGSLALSFPPAGPTVPLRLVPPALPDEQFEPQPTPRTQLPDPRAWTRRLSQVLAEILAGARPVAQVSRFATLDVLDHLERAAARRPSVSGREMPMRPVVASVHVSEPADGVAEVCAVLDTGTRRRALALRLEGLDGRWQCTAVHVG